MRSFNFLGGVIAIVLTLASDCAALAHPHILATVHMEVLFLDNGAVRGLRQTWAYDPVYSSFARRKIDADGDGKLSVDELADFAKTQLADLKEHSYFTRAWMADAKMELGDALDYALVQTHAGILELNFTLPVRTSVAPGEPLTIELYDPNFFAYFTMAEAGSSATLVGAPEGCATAFSGPKPIDLTHPPSIPSAFWAALDGSSEAGKQFVNRIVVTCQPPTQVLHR